MPNLLSLAPALCLTFQPMRNVDDRILINVYRTHAVEFRDWQIERINHYLRDPAFRKRQGPKAFRDWSARMQNGLRKLRGAEAPKLYFGTNFGHIGYRDHPLAIGMMGYLRAVDVLQIRSDDEMLVHHDGLLLSIQGFNNTRLADDISVTIPDLLLVSGRKTYRTVLGTTKTVFVLKPFDVVPFMPKYGRAAKDSAFVGSSKRKMFHSESCRSVAKIAEADRIGFDTAIDARFYGFSTCRACSP